MNKKEGWDFLENVVGVLKFILIFLAYRNNQARYILFLTQFEFSLPALSFKREGAKKASFLEVKLFIRRHISKWVRNSMYLAFIIVIS